MLAWKSLDLSLLAAVLTRLAPAPEAPAPKSESKKPEPATQTEPTDKPDV